MVVSSQADFGSSTPVSNTVASSLKRPVALITGGSSGIGYELATCFAKDGCDLILVAFNKEKLQKAKDALVSQFGVSVATISEDLSVEGAAQRVYDQVQALGYLAVDYLVNNAGYGIAGTFIKTDLTRQEAMLRTNIMTLTELCYLFGIDMAACGHGGILNLASIAAFMPGPYMATYYASKAYVQSFSEALHTELSPYGIHVSALCPPPTKTAFFTKAGYGKNDLFQHFALSSKTVAKQGYLALKLNQAQCLPGLFTKLTVLATRLTPQIVFRGIIAALQKGPAERADAEREKTKMES